MMLSGKQTITLTLLMLFAFAQITKAEPVAKAILINPSILAKSADSPEREINRGDKIYHKDTLTSDEHARAILRFNEGTMLTMSGNTQIKIEEFTFTEGQKQARFEFLKGAFRMVTGAITKTSNPNFTVNTPIGSIGVRGTDFWSGNLNNDESIDVVLLESEHTVEVSNQYGKVVLTQTGEGTTLLPNKPPLSPRKWPQQKLNRALKTVATQ
ncbi:MAG: FecR domain-containing protein [Bermanella sp.]